MLGEEVGFEELEGEVGFGADLDREEGLRRLREWKWRNEEQVNVNVIL